MPSLRRSAAYALVLFVILLLVAGCGKRGSGEGGSGEDGKSGPRVGLVTDLGGLNDRSFNTLANQGLEQAKNELNADGAVLESKSASDYEANLGDFAQQGLDIVFAVGFLMADPVKNVAGKAEDTKFGIIDFDYGQGEIPPNVRGLLFKEQEAGYLAGALAGMVEQDGKLKGLNSAKVVSVVGGQKIPPVDRYIAGFQAGVKAFCKQCKILVNYSEEFLAQEKCKEQALSQIGQGSDIVFQVAGGCGLGSLDAAKQKGVWGIGVDADQAHLGSHILTSALKRVDVAVYDTIKAVQDGTFEGGSNAEYGLAQDGVGLGKIAPAAQAYQARMKPVIADITSGTVTPPTDVT